MILKGSDVLANAPDHTFVRGDEIRLIDTKKPSPGWENGIRVSCTCIALRAYVAWEWFTGYPTFVAWPHPDGYLSQRAQQLLMRAEQQRAEVDTKKQEFWWLYKNWFEKMRDQFA